MTRIKQLQIEEGLVARQITFTVLVLLLLAVPRVQAQRQMEKLDRGIIAAPQADGDVFVSWRLLGTDPSDVAFNLYRTTGAGGPVRLNETPLMEGTNFVDEEVDASPSVSYFVRPVHDGEEQAASEPYTLKAEEHQYFDVPLQTPEGYTPNDASVGDLDGDSEYEIVLHQTGRAHDNAHEGFTDPPIIEAYEMDGTRLWRINLGINIREGAHYTQFIVYDLDGDSKAEVAMKTADGTTDGAGNVIGDADADYRNEEGYILEGPEYLTIFDGETGAALATTDYLPPRHPDTLHPTRQQLKEVWGDGYGNRADRFLAAVAYLDGRHPSLIMTRGYYTRAVLVAWDWREEQLTHRWTFDTDDGTPGRRAYRGEGNHNLSVADVDGDERDEIIFGAAAIDDDGTGLHATGLGHGDVLHLSDLNPDHPGLEVFNIQERFGEAGVNVRDAETGEILWKKPSTEASDEGEGPGRGLAANVDPRYRGAESWVFGGGIEGMFNANGKKITSRTPRTCNFAVWWDGDLQRELLDENKIFDWNWQQQELETLLVAEESTSNNGTKATPALSADLFGDWREEVIWRTEDNDALRIYTTTMPTEHRFVTLMHDPVYRLGIAWQNVGYNQPPHPRFYIGEDMDAPPPVHMTTPSQQSK